MTSPASFTDFAETISANARIIDEFLNSNSTIPRPSFAPDGPIGFPCPPQITPIHAAREALLDASKKLYQLALGPLESLFELAVRCHDSACLHAIYRFDMAAKVPVDGEKSFAEIAEAIGVDEDRTRRVLKFAMTNGLFKEARPGFVSHTSVSALMAQNTMGVNAVVGHVIDDTYPASCKLADTMEKYPVPKNRLIETPFAMAYQTGEPFFDYMKKHPHRINRFQEAMRAINNSGPYSGETLAQGYDWSPFESGTLVDVGGSSGHTALKIADASSISNIIVQDINVKEVKNAQKGLEKKYEGRVRFMEHDFFKPQPVKDADAYFFRLIFHDWPDQECIEILRNLVPALKSGASILICDSVLPEPNTVPNRLEKEARICDLHMLSLIGSTEREIGAWQSLFAAADPRFKFIGAKQPSGSVLSVVEAKWEANGALANGGDTNGVNGS
ncbi:hypothetical protein EPUS_07119 [Endocarpon pusillum Z07020]|uniref:Uncharacterized protein n=1 Tax=Endocarpon pusillum (strain Z07020 / HMAS-L-300199) TaxID=1263415 RepID=U1HRA4_ENDPU|nr:uncharacterized protein EPUS_07119 [Endocarpon pusillum Z07020]ERF73025.1 hypothetical protein EPUS_07119 [Endocarpon pusillum Z07020]